MEYQKLGHTDLNVSRVCMGCMGFGDNRLGQHVWTLDETKSREIIHAGLSNGINFFDTAAAYQCGTSEKYLGKALKESVRRDEVVVATKFLPRTKEEMEAGVSGQTHIQNAVEQSLRNLGTAYIDLYIYHMWDDQTPLYEWMDGLDRVIRAGKVRYIGISNCYAYQLAKANALAKQEGFQPFVAVQGHYNLIFREEEREMVRLCKEDDIAITPYSPLAGGRLSKRKGQTSPRLETDSYAKGKYDGTALQDQKIIDRVAILADQLGVSMTQVSLAWLLARVNAPVVGMTKLEHVTQAAAAVNLHLTTEQMAYLEELYVPHALVGVMAQNQPTGVV